MKTLQVIVVCFAMCIAAPLFSQNETEINAGGILIPRLDRTTVSSPSLGQLVFDINTNTFWFYEGSQWLEVDNDNQTLTDVLGESNDAGAMKITNLSDPSSDQDAATKKYVDDLDAAESAARIANDDNLQLQINADIDGDVTNEIQDLSTTGASGNISISSGSTLNLNVDDADADATNENNTNVALVGNDLQVTDGGGTLSTSLAVYLDNTDDQQIDNFSITSDILSLEIENDGQSVQTVDLSPYLDNTDNQDLTNILSQGNDAGGNEALNFGKIGIGTSTPKEKLDVDGAIKISNNIDTSPEAGTIRWNAAANDFQGFNGTKWLSLTYFKKEKFWGNNNISYNSTESNKIVASDGALADNFGYSVSISGDYAIVGARWDDDNGIDSGSAYIFKRSGTSWAEEAKLTASDGTESDYFGYSVSISGDYAIVGARWDDDNGIDSGSAYIFD